MLNTAYEYDKRPSAANPRRTATHGDTGLFFGTPDVDAVYTHLRAKAIDVKEPKIAPYGMKLQTAQATVFAGMPLGRDSRKTPLLAAAPSTTA
jgi:hypothetical protein